MKIQKPGNILVRRKGEIIILAVVVWWLIPQLVLAKATLTPHHHFSLEARRQIDEKIYLPLLLSNFPAPENIPVMLGLYTQGPTGSQSTMDGEVATINTWSGKKVSIIGTFISIEVPHYPAYVTDQLTTLWNSGYTPFVNLDSTRTAYQIASGQYDTALRAWANAYEAYATAGGGRMAFIAPLQEMNSCMSWGCWTSYGGNPTNFKYAYAHIRQIFAEEGVPADSVRWVFAPNGWSDPVYDYPFEQYYPGDASVDVVAFSGYNFGRHPNLCPNADWQDPLEVYNTPYIALPGGHYLDRMRSMAPTKPIFISQTGTGAYLYCGQGQNTAKKDSWLETAYDYLAGYEGVRGIIYFNLTNTQGYDWPFYVVGDPAHQYQGYINGVDNPAIGYISPATLKNLDLSITP